MEPVHDDVACTYSADGGGQLRGNIFAIYVDDQRCLTWIVQTLPYPDREECAVLPHQIWSDNIFGRDGIL